jgi:large subunit ribosomal protein L15
METLKEVRLIKRERDGVKLLGSGEISYPLNVKVHQASKTARQKIESAGGTVEII